MLFHDHSPVTPDDLWTPYKQLSKVVEASLTGRTADSSNLNLELYLRKYKPNFVNLLKNPVI